MSRSFTKIQASIILLFFAMTHVAVANEASFQEVQKTRLEGRFGRLPLYFIQNRGQVDNEVCFYIKGRDKTLYFTSKGITFVLERRESISTRLFDLHDTSQDQAQHPEAQRWVVKLDFVGANPDIRPTGEDKQKAVFSYFRGKPEEWKTGIPSYSRIVYRDLWPGIDLLFHGTVNRLKYEFVVKPTADPGQICMSFSGASNVRLNEHGDLEIQTPLCKFMDEMPIAFQEMAGGRQDVSVMYLLDETKRNDRVTISFLIDEYDTRNTLVIDPVFLVYCGYIGGRYADDGNDIAVDDKGNLYVSGGTFSSELDGFPVFAGPDLTYNGGDNDAFVAKVSASGDSLLYCGYIGGAGLDYCYGLSVDSIGNAYITGATTSRESQFPVIVGPDLSYNGETDSFVAKVSSSGLSLEYCGYIGGTAKDWGNGIAVGEDGSAYVTGYTYSNVNDSFPVKVGPDLTYNGGSDVFVAKVSASGSLLDYCGYIGGTGPERGNGIALDGEKNAYVAGWTGSTEDDGFPVKVGPDLTYNLSPPPYHWSDGFVAKVKASGASLDYCGYIGGMFTDECNDIAVDEQGCAYVTGTTDSSQYAGFPVLIGPDVTWNGYDDAFVAKVAASGASLLYCGYIGGTSLDRSGGVDVDAQGNAYIVGHTRSSENDGFPVLEGPDLTHNGLNPYDWDAFVAKVAAFGNPLLYCGYIGGVNEEQALSIAVDDFGAAYVTGFTESSENDGFPILVGPDLTYNGTGFWGGDAFVAKVVLDLSSNPHVLPINGGSIDFRLCAGTANAGRSYFLLGSATGTFPGTTLPGGLILPLNWDAFTDIVILMANTPILVNFNGTLDAIGTASSQLNALAPLPPEMIGMELSFAYLLYGPFDFVSKPVGIEIVP